MYVRVHLHVCITAVFGGVYVNTYIYQLDLHLDMCAH